MSKSAGMKNNIIKVSVIVQTNWNDKYNWEKLTFISLWTLLSL